MSETPKHLSETDTHKERVARLLHTLRSPILGIRLELTRAAREGVGIGELNARVESHLSRVDHLLDEYWCDISGDAEESPEVKLPATAGGNGRHVLIVEDDELHGMVLERILKKFGCLVDRARSGQEAIDRLREKQFRISFLDINMGDLDAYGLCRIAKENGVIGGLGHIVGMSNDPRTEVLTQRCIAAGIHDYLPKPLSAQQLKALLGQETNGAAKLD